MIVTGQRSSCERLFFTCAVHVIVVVGLIVDAFRGKCLTQECRSLSFRAAHNN